MTVIIVMINYYSYVCYNCYNWLYSYNSGSFFIKNGKRTHFSKHPVSLNKSIKRYGWTLSSTNHHINNIMQTFCQHHANFVSKLCQNVANMVPTWCKQVANILPKSWQLDENNMQMLCQQIWWQGCFYLKNMLSHFVMQY